MMILLFLKQIYIADGSMTCFAQFLPFPFCKKTTKDFGITSPQSSATNNGPLKYIWNHSQQIHKNKTYFRAALQI